MTQASYFRKVIEIVKHASEIRRAMRDQRVSTKTLIKKTGLSPRTVRSFLDGKTASPHFSTVEACYRALGMRVIGVKVTEDEIDLCKMEADLFG